MKSLLFEKLRPDSPEFIHVQQMYWRKIAPCYGDQTAALKKIAESRDRACYLLYEDSRPVGLVVFKTHLVNEFAPEGIENSFEIKTLCLFDADHDSGKGFGTFLLAQVAEHAIQLKARAITVTTSACKPDALRFFQTMGFRRGCLLKDRYQHGLDEIVLVHDNPEALLSLTQRFLELKRARLDLPLIDQKIQKVKRRRAA